MSVAAGVDRTAILEQTIYYMTKDGWRVSSQTSYSAQFEKGKPTNHVLHLILTILTAGLWLIVWIIVATAAGHKQKHVLVADDGQLVWS